MHATITPKSETRVITDKTEKNSLQHDLSIYIFAFGLTAGLSQKA
jgi:hypothetical protein